ncbi:MAG: DEAD/DEAH box helicase [Chloroflexota bacterium]
MTLERISGCVGTNMSDDTYLPPGLYEQLLTDALRRRLPEDRSDFGKLPDDAYGLLTRHVSHAVDRALRAPGLELGQRVALCNRLLDEIAQSGPTGAVTPGDRVPSPTELLTAIRPPTTGQSRRMAFPRPETPVSEDALFVNAPHEPSLARELRTELLSADRVDLLCAFIVWSGIRIVLDELEKVRRRGIPVRVITTTYTGITDPRALDRFTELGAEVKVSYDTRMTRLHAKAWLFHRDSGFSTAYIGSSNLTHSALHEGLEWNVRLSQVHSTDLLERFRAAFETYWSDVHFVPYQRDEFVGAVKRERAHQSIDFTPFDIVPYEYQRIMLDSLQVERERHGRRRNLVVAATGTGKTIVAALDYKRTAQNWGGASLLFVAHRQEILDQSRSLFRHALRDGAFGELWVGGHRPLEGRHVFASVQSLAHVDLDSIEPDAYDIVIIDEFHHAAAPTYRRLLDHLKPRLLLGLTATPERGDSRDILEWFGGKIAVELRLWDALDQGLLCPFQYFGVADGVDLNQLEWRRTGYDIGALSNLYTANDLRTGKILKAVNDIVSDPLTMRAFGFCVSVEHAEYMAQSFNRAGIPSRVVIGTTDPVTRAYSIGDLRNRQVNVIFTVDVFNEGVDIPELDTVLLLRPTESATVFLQQLGRGLRLAEGKSGLTVLDFIGQQHRKFRFDSRFQALTGIPARKLEATINQDFPYLPSGCYVQLDRVAKEVVLEDLKAVIDTRHDLLVRELRELGDVSLLSFLNGTDRSLEDVFRGGRAGWMNLRRDAGLPTPPADENDDALVAAISRMFHIDDSERLDKYCAWLRADAPPRETHLSTRDVRLLTMLHFELWSTGGARGTLGESLSRLWSHEAIRLELAEVLEALAAQCTALVLEDRRTVEPLAVHAHYSRNEVLAAVGAATTEKPRSSREGVAWIAGAHADVFFVTLRKAEKYFSPTTMYHDYAISPREFHWESQSTTSVSSPTGQRYINHVQRGSRVLLFAREDKQQRAYLYLGPVRYVRHEGDRPIAITWRLDWEIPPQFFLEARAVG